VGSRTWPAIYGDGIGLYGTVDSINQPQVCMGRAMVLWIVAALHLTSRVKSSKCPDPPALLPLLSAPLTCRSFGPQGDRCSVDVGIQLCHGHPAIHPWFPSVCLSSYITGVLFALPQVCKQVTFLSLCKTFASQSVLSNF
jgi:hypothetical protein